MIKITKQDAAMCLLALNEYRVQLLASAETLLGNAHFETLRGNEVLCENLTDAAHDRDKEAARAKETEMRLRAALRENDR